MPATYGDLSTSGGLTRFPQNQLLATLAARPPSVIPSEVEGPCVWFRPAGRNRGCPTL